MYSCFVVNFQLASIPLSGPLLHRILSDPVINSFDLALLLLFLVFLGIETTADQQQWNFHQRKGKVEMRAKGKDMLKGKDLMGSS